MREKLKKILKIITIPRLILIILLLICNSYAWFIFSTKASTSLDAKVIAWKVQFDSNNMSDENLINIEVDKIYPGMEDYVQTVEVYNLGDIDAKLTYEVESIKVFDETFTVGENITKEDLEKKIEREFPFMITVNNTSDNVSAESGTGSFTITFEWEFESGDDKLDTEWGEKAYEFYQTYPDEKSFGMKIRLIVQQAAQ